MRCDIRWTEIRAKLPGDPGLAWILSSAIVVVGLAVLDLPKPQGLADVLRYFGGVLVIAMGGMMAFLAWKAMQEA